jgi:UDP-N-acetylglucosamine--N-acetylmuramyl-(pentapeptide) pyrophosphoryl-undecaprenol N-acetylglucosamine transferase
MRILFTGGGTGGHIYPIIAIKSAFAKATADKQAFEFLYVGPDSFARSILEKEGIKCKFILAGKIRRYFSPFNFIDFFKIPIGFIQSLWHLFWFMPDAIFGKGGYGSVPVVLAGWFYKIPIIIHESDSIPGLANRILVRFSKKIIISFEETKKYFPDKKIVLQGNPIREELTQGTKEEGKSLFKLTSDKPIILIIGGSQGAEKINEIVLNALTRLLERCEIIHVCGTKHFKDINEHARKTLEKLGPEKIDFYHLYPFLEGEKLKHAYAVSDIIVSRAGAGSVFEIAATGKPSILIPLSSSASDHQVKNARALAKTGGTIILEENNLTINMFLDIIFDLLNKPEKLKEMGEKAKSFYKPETNQKIAGEIIRLCQ